MPEATLETRDQDAADSNLGLPREIAGAPARLICKPEVLARAGVSYPTIWQWMRDGKFPRSRQLGGRAAWINSEIEQWILSRPVRRLKGDK